MLEPDVQHDELAVALVVGDELLDILPRVELQDGGVAVSVVEDVADELVGADGLLLVDLLHALVEAEVRDLVDLLPGAEGAGGVGLVAHHEEEVHVAAAAAQLYHERVDLAAVLAVARRVLHHHEAVLRLAEGLVKLVDVVDFLNPLVAASLLDSGGGSGGFCSEGAAGGVEFVDEVFFWFG